jgi:phospholipase C
LKVLIVAKTHVSSAYCVGGLGLDVDGQRVWSLRLYEPNWSFPPVNTSYDVGQCWDMSYVPSNAPRPPHVEDVMVTHRQFVGHEASLGPVLRRHVLPWSGGVSALFDGKLHFTGKRRGYIEESSIPSLSTGFWLPDQELQKVDYSGKIYYRYGLHELSYVGTAQSIAVIPAGTLVRVSLARWWKPKDAADDFPERCYLQLSGWY